ncbi:MAG: hypothetical protein RR623_08375 [Bacilli bacterium]
MQDERAIYPELLYFRTKVLKKTIEETINGLDISPQTYLRSENGSRELTLREANQIAKNLNLSLYVLFPKIFNNEVAKNATK